MVSEAGRLDALSPSNFGSWIRTRADFAAAIKAGPGIVALVGPEGSGKTYTLTAFALALAGQGAKLRVPGQPLEPGVSIDLVDIADADASERLAAEPEFPGIRAVALRPDLLAPLLLTHPGMRVVRVSPMAAPDVRTMLETRRRQLRLPADAFTFKACSSLDRLCGGNPRKLDRLLGRAERAARAAKSHRISGEHVAQADRDLAAAERGGARRPLAGPPHPTTAPAVMAAKEAVLRINANQTNGRPVASTKASPFSPAIALPSRSMPEPARNPVPAPVPARPPTEVTANWDSGSDGLPNVDEARPLEPAMAEASPNAHAAMWDLLATPSSPADLATARKLSRQPSWKGARLAGIGIITAATLILLANDFGQVRRFADIAALKAQRHVARMAETRPNAPHARVQAQTPPQTNSQAPARLATTAAPWPARSNAVETVPAVEAIPPVPRLLPGTQAPTGAVQEPAPAVRLALPAVEGTSPTVLDTAPVADPRQPIGSPPSAPVQPISGGTDASPAAPTPAPHATEIRLNDEAAAFPEFDSAASPAASVIAATMPQAVRTVEAARLLALGKVLVSIGQTADAQEMFRASARMSNANATASMGDEPVQ